MSTLSAADKITTYILDNITLNTVPWRPDYKTNAPAVNTPLRNNGEYYRGINNLVLYASAIQHGFTSPYWITFKQCIAEGGNLKGQKGSQIVKFGTREVENSQPDKDSRTIPYIKHYTVFNIEQASGLPDDFTARRTVAEQCTHSLHDLVNACGVELLHGNHIGCYYPAVDQIRMPNKSSYTDDNAYAATLAHELIHATGHPSRLNRDLAAIDDAVIAFEELIAEIGSALLLSRLNIPARLEERTIPYIAGWIKAMNNDPRYILQASAAAQKAIDRIMDTTKSETVLVA